MAYPTSIIHIDVDNELFDQASQVLLAAGLSLPDAVRIVFQNIARDPSFLNRLKAPNAETQAAMAESRQMMAARRKAWR